MGICGYAHSNYLEIYADNSGCMLREIFLLKKRKCSYESVVEMPDLVLVLLLTYFYTFVLVCILVNCS